MGALPISNIFWNNIYAGTRFTIDIYNGRWSYENVEKVIPSQKQT